MATAAVLSTGERVCVFKQEEEMVFSVLLSCRLGRAPPTKSQLAVRKLKLGSWNKGGQLSQPQSHSSPCAFNI